MPRMYYVLLGLLTVNGVHINVNSAAAFDGNIRTAARQSNLTSFERDVLPVLTKAGCNAGRCHASEKFHGNFRLSPLGSRSTDDYVAIVDGPGRVLIDQSDPKMSLLLRKATSAVNHNGRALIAPDSAAYRVLLKWITDGTPVSRDQNPWPLRLSVSPLKIQGKPGAEFQLEVQSFESANRTIDVSSRATYAVTEILKVDGAAATVSKSGRVKLQHPGRSIISIRYAGRHLAVPVTVPVGDPIQLDQLPRAGFIDELLIKEWERQGMTPSDEANDFRFMRRVFLRLIGRLPKPSEVIAFSESKAVEKRCELIDSLLSRPEYAEHWGTEMLELFAMKESDLSRQELAIFAEWLRESLRDNRPLSGIVRDLLTAQGTPQSNGAVLFYRVNDTPQKLAEATARIAVGVNARCFRCHNHPHADWRPADYHALAACFAGVAHKGANGRWGIFPDSSRRLRHPETASILQPAIFGIRLNPTTGEDPRRALAQRLTNSSNRLLARRLVDWYWSRLFGDSLTGGSRTDPVLATQTPVHPELLDKLVSDFVLHGYDAKHLLRTICRSRAFALTPENPRTREAARIYFHSRSFQRLSPVVLQRAMEQAAGVPIDDAGRNEMQFPGWKMFQRSPAPSQCDRHREKNGNLPQALHLINSNLMQRLITHPRGRVARLSASKKTDREILDELVLCTLSRHPDKDTIERVKKFAAKERKKGTPRQHVFEDVLWALMNTKEFLFVD
jgi:hypothetical protein